MATLKEEADRLAALVRSGRGDEKIHVVYVDQDAKERAINKKERTRFIMETDSPHAYRELNEQKDRYLRLIENKTVAISVMIAILKLRTDAEIRAIAED